ncbi:hypothetical protein GB927_004405 [Shinella sp. CPCC 100929]|uniref:PilZ domain-containing protein n=2 Tax=Shinella lacus TaxID=2654216 RepID=A0ABT1R273_9HYPH|nr:hypothetical protein [Shinella lacus]
MRLSRSSPMVSPETEERQHDKDDDDEADNVDNPVHDGTPFDWEDERRFRVEVPINCPLQIHDAFCLTLNSLACGFRFEAKATGQLKLRPQEFATYRLWIDLY